MFKGWLDICASALFKAFLSEIGRAGKGAFWRADCRALMV
jgi:hypothetical protein